MYSEKQKQIEAQSSFSINMPFLQLHDKIFCNMHPFMVRFGLLEMKWTPL